MSIEMIAPTDISTPAQEPRNDVAASASADSDVASPGNVPTATSWTSA